MLLFFFKISRLIKWQVEVDVSKWSWDAAEVVEVAEYLDGVGVAIAVPAQMGRSKSNPCLDGFRLTREVAQVDPCFREQVLTSCSRNVLHSIRHAYIKFRFNSSKKTNKKNKKKLDPQCFNPSTFLTWKFWGGWIMRMCADYYRSIRDDRRGWLWRWPEPDRNVSFHNRKPPLAGCGCGSFRNPAAQYSGSHLHDMTERYNNQKSHSLTKDSWKSQVKMT